MATATKTKTTKKTKVDKVEAEAPDAVEELDEQIKIFEPVPAAVQRIFVHPETGEEKVYIQHEMGFLTKLKFFRLLSGTIRLAADTTGTNASDIFDEIIGDDGTGSYFNSILQLVELAPDFIEEAYVLALKVPAEDLTWFREALEELDDEQGIEIIDTFIAQNAKALKRFFDQYLRKVGKRFSQEINLTALESEDTQ